MTDYTQALLVMLIRCSVAVAVTAVVVQLLLWSTRARSARWHQIAWFGVLLQGCLLGVWTVDVPWHAPATSQDVIIDLGGPDLAMAAAETPAATPAGLTRTRSSTSDISWPAILVATWLVGALTVAVRFSWRYLSIARTFPQRLEPDPSWLAQWERLVASSHVTSPPTLWPVDGLGPFLCRLPSGYRLVVPADRWGQLSPRQRETILRHELQHAASGDVWKSLLMRLLALPHWFNPFAWLAVRRFEEALEWACDQHVRAETPDALTEYARALTSLGNSTPATPLLSPAAHGRGLVVRVRRLLSPIDMEDSRMKKLTVLIVLVGMLALNVVRLELVAADAPDSDATATESKEGANAARTGVGGEAVVDVKRIFKELPSFNKKMKALKQKVTGSEGELRAAKEKMQAIQAKLNKLDLNGKDAANKKLVLLKELQQLNAAAKASVEERRAELVSHEAQIYYEEYSRLTKVVRDFAKENGIRIVRRADLSGTGPEDIDPTNHKAVLQSINRQVLFVDRDQMDITDAILKRLKAADESNREESSDTDN